MSKIGAVVVRETRENLRQTWLVLTLAVLLGVIATFSLYLLYRIDGFAQIDGMDRKLGYWMEVMGMPLEDPLNQLAGLVVQVFDYLMITQLLSMTAVLAGHAALHDRQTGTLPFLLLAPITRLELLVGKVLGAMAVPLMLYVLIGGTCAALASAMQVTASQAVYLPPSPGWLVAFFLGAPAWAIFLGTLCTSISSLAHDVRTAQQAAWFLVFFATFVVCPLLVNLLPMGVMAQLAVAAVGVLLTIGALLFTRLVISRDLGR